MTSQAGTVSIKPLFVNPPHLHDPRPNGYSNVVIAPATGRLAFISGQGGQDQTGSLSPDFGTQVAQAYANLAALLDALGASADQVVKLTVFVVDHDMSKLGILTQNVMSMFGFWINRSWSPIGPKNAR
jgi:enamine deaminase RidA (YjgF/YER057c/UK114 family)